MRSKLFLFSLCGLLLASCLTILPFGFWWIGPLTSFHLQLFLCNLIAVALCWKRRRLAFVFALACCGHGFILAPSFLGHTRVEAHQDDVRLMVSNVLTSNTDYEKFLDVVRETNPDVLILLEVSELWIDALQPLEASFPYRISHPRSDNFGIAMWSRLPFEGKVRYFDSRLPSITATLQRDHPITLVATHPIPPISERALGNRNAQLQAIASFAADCETPVVVAGDLNTASWSPSFRAMCATGSLQSAAQGWIPTWPTHQFALLIPLDHILHSDDIGISDFASTGSVGSDHYPVYADLRALTAGQSSSN